MAINKKVFPEQHPFFGADTQETELLRKLATTLREWRDSTDVSMDDVMSVLEDLDRIKVKKRQRN